MSATPDATGLRLPHDCTCDASAPTPDVRAFLRELTSWLANRQYRLEEARDAGDAAYRRGWNAAVAHVAVHAQEHEQAIAGTEQGRSKHGGETVGTVAA